jgi:membrane-associated phospholipid phosphatase
MLLWVGLFCIAVGIACVAIDRRAVHFIYDHVGTRFHRFLDATTHLAKAAHWLAAALTVYAVTWIWLRWGVANVMVKLAFQCALAFVLSLATGSAILHGTKLVLGRRRPRDELEMNLYGFVPLGFSLDWNSFPSGHALTIACVAVIATALWPQWAIVWFAVALWLGLTRALLTAHFLSDVFVGAGIGLVSAREVVVNFFPHLAPGWF